MNGLQAYQERENNKRMETQQAESDRLAELRLKLHKLNNIELVDMIIKAGFEEQLKELLADLSEKMTEKEQAKLLSQLVNLNDWQGKLVDLIIDYENDIDI